MFYNVYTYRCNLYPLFAHAENVMAFAWEPTGNKFAYIHGESSRISVSFYVIRPQGKVELVSK